MADKSASNEPASPRQPQNHVNPFAVPERHAASPKRVMDQQILPEVPETEDEEDLIQSPDLARAASRLYGADRFEKWFVFLLFVFGVLALALTASDMGMCWDEVTYLETAERTSNWIRACLGPGPAPIRGETLKAYWLEPQGHPSISRFLAAMGWILHQWLAGEGSSSQGAFAFMRLITAVLYGLTLVVLYILVRRTHGRISAWITVLAYFFMPQVFGHAHFAVTETPMVLIYLLVVYSFIRGLGETHWAILLGVFFGVAMAAKINALLLPAILLPWAFLYYRRESLHNLYALIFISPVVMVLVWPWLWDLTIEHFLDYLKWNLGHFLIRVLYFGVVYDSAPWHYPWVMTLLTVPVCTLLLCALGIGRCIRAPRKHYFGLLYLWAALVPLLSLTVSAAKYDGVRLFINAFPFIAALAGIGGAVLVRIAAFFDRSSQRVPRAKAMMILLLLAVMLNGSWAVLSVRPYYLTYFNILIGGPQGAYARGMETSYWCEALNGEALERINETIPDGASLMPLAFTSDLLRVYQKWGVLKPSIRIVADQGPADYHLLQYRRGIFARPEWTLFEDYTPLFEIGAPGVPMFGFYKTGLEFESRWPQKTPRQVFSTLSKR